MLLPAVTVAVFLDFFYNYIKFEEIKFKKSWSQCRANISWKCESFSALPLFLKIGISIPIIFIFRGRSR